MDIKWQVKMNWIKQTEPERLTGKRFIFVAALSR